MTKGKIPKAGLDIQSAHHKGHLELDDKGNLSGTLESKATPNGTFKLSMKNGQISGGTYIHKGKTHNTTVSIGKDGWKAGVSGGKGKTKWSFNIENGKAEAKAFGGFEMKF